jgi:hypothetical protein
MTRAFSRRRALMIVPGILLVLALLPPFAAVPSTHASSKVAAAVTTAPVSYRFDAQLVSGDKAGSTVYGMLGGNLDSTGVLTATLTTNSVLAPIKAGCAAYIDFGPQCGLPPTANVRGNVGGRVATLTAVGKGWTWVLAGSLAGKDGWTGTLTQGSAFIGTWSLKPIMTNLSIQGGTKSDAKSKHKIALVGGLDLHVTADGWAVGTFSDTLGHLPVVVQGYVNDTNGSLEVAVPMGKGAVLVTAWSRQGFGVLNWTGTFVGPATGDYGTWIGRG